MEFKFSADDAAWQFREAADEACWSAREAAWRLEERVLWPASDGAHAVRHRARGAVAPLQRLVQTRLVWPLADRLDDYGTGTRTAVATTAALAAIGAGVAGAMVAAPGSSTPEATAAAPAPMVAAQTAGASLQGVVPDFVADPNGGSATQAPKAAPPAPGEATPEQVAWRFAQAFVLYEVGQVDEEVITSFRESAARPLADALGTEPPRLPAAGKVPEARVLNVVVGERSAKQLTVSVSLLRLQAASELRLTLRETPAGWRVTEVLG